jgi:hypothetical protein
MSQFKKIYNINPAKVASASFYHGLRKKYHKNVFHSHNLNLLNEKLKNDSNNLFICGIRNPITRNESYFFQTRNDKFHNDFKTKKNRYRGEYCFTNETDLIKAFNERDNKYTYLDWLQEFIEITGIDEYDKERGYSVYNLINNNRLIIYTFEKLKTNKIIFERMLDFQLDNKNINRSREYKFFKNRIEYETEYLDKLLKNDLIDFFYQEKDINLFYINALENHKISTGQIPTRKIGGRF